MDRNGSSFAGGSRINSIPVLATIIIWGVIIASLAKNGAFQAKGELPPVNILFAAVIPPGIFLFAYRFVAAVRAWVSGLDLALITGLQGWRVVGAAFVFAWGYGQLPAGFAAPAGIGDILVGLMAPFVAMKVARQTPDWQKASRMLIIAGMADFTVAFTMGIALRDRGVADAVASQHTGLLAEFPLTMIPSFLVPAFIILHLIVLLRLRAAR